MSAIISSLIVFACFGALSVPLLSEGRSAKGVCAEVYYIIIMLIAAAGVRTACAYIFTGHSYDMSCFRSWASRLAGGGFAAFYASDNFNNYPPGYMYILRIAGMINTSLKLNQQGFNFLLKLPAMLADLAVGYGIYRFALKRSDVKGASIAAALWLFNPAVIINSSLWGQVDVIYTLVIGLMLYFITEKKLIPSYFAFAIAILLKPQAFVMTPILIFGIIEQVFLPGFDRKVFIKNLLWGLAAIACLFALCIPFGIGYVINQYIETLHGNIYFTQNAFNMWGALGRNYIKVTTAGSVIGYILMAVSVALTAFVYFRSRNKSKVFFCAGLLMTCFYMLSVKMNERYAYAAVLFFLLAFVNDRSADNLLSFILISLSQFFNMAWVLFVFETDNKKYFFDPWIRLYSAINIIMFIYIIYTALKSCSREKSNE